MRVYQFRHSKAIRPGLVSPKIGTSTSTRTRTSGFGDHRSAIKLWAHGRAHGELNPDLDIDSVACRNRYTMNPGAAGWGRTTCLGGFSSALYQVSYNGMVLAGGLDPPRSVL